MKKTLFLTAAVAMMTLAAACGQNAQKQTSTESETAVAQQTEQSQGDIESRITKDILSLPEMKFENAAIMIVGEPSDEEPYYTVKGGSDMETHFATSYWFHVYVKPKYEIKVYDVAMDEEMSLEEWRNQ